VPSDGESPKLTESKSIRDLAKFIDDENALNIFRAADGSLSRALAKYEIDHPEDCFPKISAAIFAVRSLTPDMLRKMEENSLETLKQLEGAIKQTLNDREKLLR
jgi:hypothetical protein